MSNNQTISLPFKFSYTKLSDLAKPLATTGITPLACLKPQLAYDPKVTNLKELYDLAYGLWSARANNSYSDFIYPAKHFYPNDSTPWAIAEEKYDGVRCQFLITYDKFKGINISAISRAGKPITSVNHLISNLINLSYDNLDLITFEPYSLVIDCELIVYGKPFPYTNGLVNRNLSSHDTEELSAIVIQAYYINNLGQTVLTKTHNELVRLTQPLFRFSMPKYSLINSYDSLEKFYNSLLPTSEGLILKSLDYHHYNGRTKLWLKFKRRITGVFKVIDYSLGEGKYTNNLGAITVMDANGLTSLVGTGFTDQERSSLIAKFAESKELFVKISYMTKVGDSLREASYQGITEPQPLSKFITRGDNDYTI